VLQIIMSHVATELVRLRRGNVAEALFEASARPGPQRRCVLAR
jgi:hypothetical protein